MSVAKRKIDWKIIGLVIGVLLAGAFIYFVFIQDDSDPNKPPDSKHVDDGPYADELREYARKLHLDAIDGGWELGLVVHDFGGVEGIKVKTGKGIVVLYSSCLRDVRDTYASTMADVGDLVVWDKYNDDHNICDGEIAVVRTKEELEQSQE